MPKLFVWMRYKSNSLFPSVHSDFSRQLSHTCKTRSTTPGRPGAQCCPPSGGWAAAGWVVQAGSRGSPALLFPGSRPVLPRPGLRSPVGVSGPAVGRGRALTHTCSHLLAPCRALCFACVPVSLPWSFPAPAKSRPAHQPRTRDETLTG